MESRRVGPSLNSWHPGSCTLKPSSKNSEIGFYLKFNINKTVEKWKVVQVLGWLIKLHHQICPLLSGCWKLFKNDNLRAWKRLSVSHQSSGYKSWWLFPFPGFPCTFSLPLWSPSVEYSLWYSSTVLFNRKPSLFSFVELGANSSFFSKHLCFSSTPSKPLP